MIDNILPAGNCSVHHRAHCDQICWQWGPDEHEEDEDPETGEELEPDHTCACFDGFVLNEEDHSTCLGIQLSVSSCIEKMRVVRGGHKCACALTLTKCSLLPRLLGLAPQDLFSRNCAVKKNARLCEMVRLKIHIHRCLPCSIADIDECAYKNAGCQGICENIPGSYHCNCSAGFDLAIDEHSCIGKMSSL